jgi:hypothetical protein
MYVHAYEYIDTDIYIDTHIYIYIHTYIHTYIDISNIICMCIHVLIQHTLPQVPPGIDSKQAVTHILNASVRARRVAYMMPKTNTHPPHTTGVPRS